MGDYLDRRNAIIATYAERRKQLDELYQARLCEPMNSIPRKQNELRHAFIEDLTTLEANLNLELLALARTYSRSAP